MTRRYDELEKRLTGKREAAAHEESEILERQHTTTTAAAANDEAEILEQHTVVTAARKEETIDSKDQELLSLIERRTIWTEKTRPK